MRTGDLHAWDWTMLDLAGFASCTIPRSKTAAPEMLDVPEMLRPFLRAWWESAGSPPAGPVFPIRKGKRAGEHKGPQASHAKRLRQGTRPRRRLPAARRRGARDRSRARVRTSGAPSRASSSRRTRAIRSTSRPRRPFPSTSIPSAGRSTRPSPRRASNVQKAMTPRGAQQRRHAHAVRDGRPRHEGDPGCSAPRLAPVPIRAQSGREPRESPRIRGRGEGGDDDANSGNSSVFVASARSSKPLVRGSSPFGRAEDREGEGDVDPCEASPQPLAAVPGAGQPGPPRSSRSRPRRSGSSAPTRGSTVCVVREHVHVRARERRPRRAASPRRRRGRSRAAARPRRASRRRSPRASPSTSPARLLHPDARAVREPEPRGVRAGA